MAYVWFVVAVLMLAAFLSERGEKRRLKKMLSERQGALGGSGDVATGESGGVIPRVEAAIRVNRDDLAPRPAGVLCDSDEEWNELGSHEKIKRVPVRALPFADGEVLESRYKSKVAQVKVTPQKAGVFEHDEAAALIVSVYCRGKEHALETVASRISESGWLGTFDSRMNGAETGRWYDGNHCVLEIQTIGKAEKSAA